jgi:hypothetical protein
VQGVTNKGRQEELVSRQTNGGWCLNMLEELQPQKGGDMALMCCFSRYFNRVAMKFSNEQHVATDLTRQVKKLYFTRGVTSHLSSPKTPDKRRSQFGDRRVSSRRAAPSECGESAHSTVHFFSALLSKITQLRRWPLNLERQTVHMRNTLIFTCCYLGSSRSSKQT